MLLAAVGTGCNRVGPLDTEQSTQQVSSATENTTAEQTQITTEALPNESTETSKPIVTDQPTEPETLTTAETLSPAPTETEPAPVTEAPVPTQTETEPAPVTEAPVPTQTETEADFESEATDTEQTDTDTAYETEPQDTTETVETVETETTEAVTTEATETQDTDTMTEESDTTETEYTDTLTEEAGAAETDTVATEETDNDAIETDPEDISSVVTEDPYEEETVHLYHSYDNACDRFCNGCGESRDVPDHVYCADCDADCDECGKIRVTFSHLFDSTSKCITVTCIKCHYVKVQDHEYIKTNYTPATLLADGHERVECANCGAFSHECDLPKLTLEDFDMPVVYITDFADTPVPLKDLEKDAEKNPGGVEEIKIYFKYDSNSDDIESFECTAKIKIQGATSAGFPKKNFTIKLYKDDTFDKKNKVDFGWGKENKYCMKANWVDFSHARNIIGANMFAELVASRSVLNEDLMNAPNFGLIDGFPILVYLNGEFHGLYTMNIPKDSWTFAMEGDETTKEALLMADQWHESVNLKEEIGDGAFEDFGWEVEYASTEDLETGTDWIKDSMNALIRLLNCGDNDRIRAELHNHLDIEAAIDNMLFTYFINAADNKAKNILWATYDGEIWIPSMYDMDGSFGIFWNGEPTPEGSDTYPYINGDGSFTIPGNRMYRALIECFPDEVFARWAFLRQDILTLENTKSYFDDFYAKAPIGAYDSDRAKWLGSGGWTEPFYYDNHTNYYESTKDHLQRLDDFFFNFNK